MFPRQIAECHVPGSSRHILRWERALGALFKARDVEDPDLASSERFANYSITRAGSYISGLAKFAQWSADTERERQRGRGRVGTEYRERAREARWSPPRPAHAPVTTPLQRLPISRCRFPANVGIFQSRLCIIHNDFVPILRLWNITLGRNRGFE